VDPVTGNLTSKSHILIAVSQTDNPLTGVWNVFTLDVSNDGDARFGGCPTGCFGDQPLIGADASGFYVATNAFALPPGAFKGGQLYAMSLAQLETGSDRSIGAVHFGNLDVVPGEPARSIQPATIPPGGTFEGAAGGTEYFVSALDPAHTVDNRVSVWAITNTSSLNSTPSLHLNNVIVDTEAYGFPPATDQKSGPTPFRDFLATQGFKNHEELIAANDDRMQQVVFANGNLWTAVPTKVQPGGQGPVRAGAAWFIFSPSMSGGQLSASVVNQGYVSIQSPMQNSVLFPAVGVTAGGKAAIAFSIAGENFFPSAAYATLDAVNGAGPIVVSDPGFAPDDGFSGYVPFIVSRVGRWGDYSAAVSDESGNLWMASEAINPPLVQLPPGALGSKLRDIHYRNHPIMLLHLRRGAFSASAETQPTDWVRCRTRGARKVGLPQSDSATGQRYPVWTPDAKTIYFGSNGKGSMHVYAKAADGSGPEQVVREEDAFDWPEDVSLVRRLSECFAMTDDGFCTA